MLTIDRFLSSRQKYEAMSIGELEAEILREQSQREQYLTLIQGYQRRIDFYNERIVDLTANINYLQDTMVSTLEERNRLWRLITTQPPSTELVIIEERGRRYAYSQVYYLRLRERRLRGTLGYIQRSINELVRSRTENRRRLTHHRNLVESARRSISEIDAELKVKEEAKTIECNVWELTRYYRYKGKPQKAINLRSFEVKGFLYFPVDWNKNSIEEHYRQKANLDELDRLYDDVLRDVLIDDLNFDAVGAEDFMQSNLSDRTYGWEALNITGSERVKRETTVDFDVISLRSYGRGETSVYAQLQRYSRTMPWRVPERARR